MRLAMTRIADATVGDNLIRGFDALESWVSEHGELKEEFSFMGLSHSDLFSSSPTTLEFVLGYPVDASQVSSGQVVVQELAGFTAAVTHCVGRVDDYIKSWDRLARDWLPRSDYELAPMPAVEMYFSDPRASNMSEWDMDCIIPVVRKNHRT